MSILGLDDARRAEGPRVAERALTYQMGVDNGFVTPTTNTTGVSVTNYTAFQVSAWWCGINVISGDIGVLDRHVFQRLGNDDREKVLPPHPTAKVLEQPNEFMVSKVFWQTLMSHVLGWGNGYAEIEYDNALRPIALWPIMPTDIEPVCEVRVDGNGTRRTRLRYRYLGRFDMAPEDVLHIPGLGFDGLRGYSVVTLARQSLGLSMALEKFGGSFFGNGAWPGMVLEHPGKLTDQARENLRSSVESMHRGSENAFKVLIAEEAMKVGKPVTVNPNDAQANETREMQILEVARWLNLPPHKLKHRMGERPGGNLETSEQDYHTGSLLPWTTTIDQVLNLKLISKAQRATHYVEHNFARRLQPAAKDRMEIQKGYLDMHVIDADQIARQENLPKPKKVEPAPPPMPPAPPPPEPAPEPPRALDLVAAARPVALDGAARFIRLEAAAARRAASKGGQEFQRWADDFYAAKADVLREMLEPACRTALLLAGSTRDARVAAQDIADGHAARSKAELLELNHKTLGESVPRLMDRWESTRAVEMADKIAALAAEGDASNVA